MQDHGDMALLAFPLPPKSANTTAWASLDLSCCAALQELLRKRRYGRLRKAMGDVALLAGSPADANDHFSTAVELSRPAQDWVWCAAALEGKAHAMVRTCILVRHVVPQTQSREPMSFE